MVEVNEKCPTQHKNTQEVQQPLEQQPSLVKE